MDLVTIHTALFMFHVYHNLLPKAFDNFFSLISCKHGYNTRLASKSTYYIDQVRTNYAKFNILFSGPSVWNNLDENLKNSYLNLFKQTMKADILSTYCRCWPAWNNLPLLMYTLWFSVSIFVFVCLFVCLFFLLYCSILS